MLDKQLFREVLETAFSDIRAEAVIADLLEGGLDPNDIVVINKGNFKRRYSRDISNIENLRINLDTEFTAFYLNRDGLYDSLPEGLFHTKTAHDGKPTQRWSEDSVKLKQEEQAARNFFMPFENEIFLQRIKLEIEERNILGRFSESIFSNLYPNLWSLHSSINRAYINRMILILHLSHKIVGDYERTAKCLENILEEKVIVRYSSSEEEKKTALFELKSESKLGGGRLGVDFVCDDFNDQSIRDVEFIIGPLQNTQAEDYLTDAPNARFLSCFFSYFIPVEINVKTIIKLEDQKMNFVLGEQAPILGYETAI